jgi:hypothetical protein
MSGAEFGIDELRAARNIFSYCNETFNQRFTTEELLAIAKAHRAAAWDFLPDTWTDQQIADALRGIVPEWDENERPVLRPLLTETQIKVLRAVVYDALGGGVAGMSTATFLEHVEELIRLGALERDQFLKATEVGRKALREAGGS